MEQIAPLSERDMLGKSMKFYRTIRKYKAFKYTKFTS